MDGEMLMCDDNIPIDVSELGELLLAEEIIPAVYYLAVEPDGTAPLEEYYLLLDGAPLSKEALRYGVPLRNGQGLVVALSPEDAGSKVISYEIMKYDIAHDLPLPVGETIHECAIYGAILHPEYFGALPAPLLTPWGYTTRARTLANGIYWLETEQGEETLAVGFPLWNADLSKAALGYAHQCDYDLSHGIDQTLGYQFFPRKAICIAVFELLLARSEWLDEDKVVLPALMNAIWRDCPEYARYYNATANGALRKLFQSLGLLTKLPDSVGSIIATDPDVGTDFWRW